MNILAIDTSSKYCCLAIAKDDTISVEFYEPLGVSLSRLIIPTIDRALKKARLSLRDIHYFAIGLGPGSFTGLRVGLSTFKGLAFSLNKPMVAIASLDIIAYSALGCEGLICPIVDARRSLVYSSIYKFSNGRLMRKSRYLLIRVTKLFRYLKGRVAFIGDGILIYGQQIQSHFRGRANFLSQELWYPRPNNLIRIARDKIRNRDFVNPDTIAPLYLYPKDCQIRAG